MLVVCGIDGSASSREAARAAAAFARRAQGSLVLVHVQEAVVLSLEPMMGATPVALASTTALESERRRLEGELEREAQRLAAEFEIEVAHTIRTGLPDHELVRVVEEREAELLVVASLGRRAATPWRFGSVADRLSQSAPVPLLVVREADSLRRWAQDERTLALLLALGTGKPTRAAVNGALGLMKLGRCTLSEVHVYDPLEEARRRGLEDPEAPETRARIEGALARELPPRLTSDESAQRARFVALPARGHVAETLAEFAEEERADLLVLGAHRHGALRRRFFGSVSYAVLPLVACNVLVVPPALARATAVAAPRVRRAVVATDLSEGGNRAAAMAFELLPEGSQLVLLHVDVPPQIPSGWIMGYHPTAMPTTGERRLTRALAESELEALARGCSRSIECTTEVVEAGDVAEAILEAAERLEADLVCLGTHHHGRVASTLIGSVARTVARRSTRPVLLVPFEPEG
jgi:nucleotide-binding universal stress UspA family protein